MALEAITDVKVKVFEFNVVDFLKKLQEQGWVFVDEDIIRYIPPGTNDWATSHDLNQVMDEIEDIRNKNDLVSILQVQMLDFMEYYDFWGIVLMAAWPNAAFDLCGIVCGMLQFPFWKFFGATLIGKGFMKAPMQCFFFAFLFFNNTIFDNILGILQNQILFF